MKRGGFPVIEWDDSLLVGFEPIDAEHMTLVQLIGELYRRLKAGGDRASVEDALFELADHVASHFNHENDLMIGSGFPGRADHLFEHRILIDLLDTVLDGIDLIRDDDLLDALDPSSPPIGAPHANLTILAANFRGSAPSRSPTPIVVP